MISFTGDSKEGGTLTADIGDIKDEDTNDDINFLVPMATGNDTSNFNDIDSGGTDIGSFTIASDQSC